MKTRILGFVFLSLSLTALLSSCTAACTHKNVVTDPATEATCTKAGRTEGKHCADCGEVLVKQEVSVPLGHTTDTGVCSRCGENFGGWELKYYVDEFGDPTSNQYVGNTDYIEGTFSNTATTNSKLNVLFVIDKDDVGIVLFEYGRNRVKNSSSRYSDDYTITMKLPNGEKIYMASSIKAGGDRILVTPGHVETVISAFSRAGSVDFYIVEDDTPTTTYRFTVETSNFAEIFKSLK